MLGNHRKRTVQCMCMHVQLPWQAVKGNPVSPPQINSRVHTHSLPLSLTVSFLLSSQHKCKTDHRMSLPPKACMTLLYHPSRLNDLSYPPIPWIALQKEGRENQKERGADFPSLWHLLLGTVGPAFEGGHLPTPETHPATFACSSLFSHGCLKKISPAGVWPLR